MVNDSQEIDPLHIGPETMRQLGYLTVDWLVEREVLRRDEPVLLRATRAEMSERLGGGAPPHGEDLPAILNRLCRDVLPFRSRIDHPRYVAYVPGEGTWPGVLGDLVASAYNIDVGNWMESSGPSQLELTVLRWFADWLGYPASSSGVLVSGGSAANLTALACAREAMAGAMSETLIAYVSDQGHSSLARAARTLGFRPHQVRVLPIDGDFRMRIDALTHAVEADVAGGRRPFVVLAVAGTTSTGSIDPLAELAEVCHRYGLWLHVDAAYGGFAAISRRGRESLAGIELADSVTLDPHKWLYQPFECGALLVREGHLLREAFEIHPDYLQDVSAAKQEVNLSDHGLQLTRMSRALKIWMSLHYFGLAAFTAAVDRAIDLARYAQDVIEASVSLELLSPATLGIVCFRRHPVGEDDEGQLEALNAALVAGLAESGLAMASSTRLAGRYAVRTCILNHSTTKEDVDAVLRWFETAPVRTAAPLVPSQIRAADVTTGWPAPDGAAVERVRSLPLLMGVEDRWVRWIATVGRRRRLEEGDTVVRQWDIDRDFYLILDGRAEVLGAERLLATLASGDFFGELAALDWGASFGYPRLATVRAVTQLDVLVLTDAELAELMSAVPLVDRRIRAVAGRRAGRI